MTVLTPHFTVQELTRSETARDLRLDNTPSAAVLEALREVATQILEPVRAHYGRPVKVNSGYRSPAVNRAVKSTPRSQHLLGQAVDFEVPGIANGALARWVRDSLDFDQLILEAYTPGLPSSGWVHCSWRPVGRRKSVMTFIPGRGYLPGLVV